MTRNRLSILVLALALAGASAALPAQQPATSQPHQHPPADKSKQQMQDIMKPQAHDMMAKCKAAAAAHEAMMTEMNAADQRLDALAAKMTGATGQAKVDATAAVVSELVSQRKTMRETMMKMHHETMGHVAEHMQAGAGSMAMCPMMKGAGGMMKK